jgi:uncharacterized membrane-anchored protein
MKKVILALVISSIFIIRPAFAGLEADLAKLNWNTGPSSAEISDYATLQFDAGYFSLDVLDTNKFLELLGNLPSNQERYGFGRENLYWFAVLKFNSSGYIKDDDEIDADDLLKDLKEGNKKGNEERRKQGLRTMQLVGWSVPPFYNKTTNRLEWGTKLKNEDGSYTINYTSRLLGRSGYVSSTLVADPQNFSSQLAEYNQVLTRFSFNSGEKYSEFQEGDKIAKFGLAALVAGGAAAAVVKSKGLWKLIGFAVLGGFVVVWGAIKSFFKRA